MYSSKWYILLIFVLSIISSPLPKNEVDPNSILGPESVNQRAQATYQSEPRILGQNTIKTDSIASNPRADSPSLYSRPTNSPSLRGYSPSLYSRPTNSPSLRGDSPSLYSRPTNPPSPGVVNPVSRWSTDSSFSPMSSTKKPTIIDKITHRKSSNLLAKSPTSTGTNAGLFSRISSIFPSNKDSAKNGKPGPSNLNHAASNQLVPSGEQKIKSGISNFFSRFRTASRKDKPAEPVKKESATSQTSKQASIPPSTPNTGPIARSKSV